MRIAQTKNVGKIWLENSKGKGGLEDLRVNARGIFNP